MRILYGTQNYQIYSNVRHEVSVMSMSHLVLRSITFPDEYKYIEVLLVEAISEQAFAVTA